MASRADLNRLGRGRDAATLLARRDLQTFWATLDLTDPAGAWKALEDFVPLLVDRYGEAAGVVAADWYDLLRRKAGAPGTYRATIVSADRGHLVDRMRRDAERFLAGEASTSTLNVLSLLTSEWINRWVNGTIVGSAAKDPAKPRVARIPKGATPCAWCLMLASRGPVYASEATALASSHGDDKCGTAPIWEGDRLPKGYDPDGLYDIYQTGREAAGSSKPGDVLAAIRAQQGIN